VLFVFATASPKGFALTLILGVLVSMLTAVLFTRAMLGILAGFAFFNKPSFMGVRAGQMDPEAAFESRIAASRRRRATATAATATAGAGGGSSTSTLASAGGTAPADAESEPEQPSEAAVPAPQRAATASRPTTSRKRKRKRR
jgi:uncharacterized membrane protein YdfJ with MMPL/SSD domain